ncbi:MAG: hypothetical protein RL557_978 [archaeon]|jgi:hypothetical protein
MSIADVEKHVLDEQGLDDNYLFKGANEQIGLYLTKKTSSDQEDQLECFVHLHSAREYVRFLNNRDGVSQNHPQISALIKRLDELEQEAEAIRSRDYCRHANR